MSSILKVDEIQNTDGKTGLVITPDGSIDSIKFPEEANPSGRVITGTTMSSYEEGEWVPIDASGAGLSIPIASASYTRIGRLCYISAYLTYPSTANSSTQSLGGLPFTAKAAMTYAQLTVRVTSNTVSADNLTFQVATNDTFGVIFNGEVQIVNSYISGRGVLISGCYEVA